MNTKRLFNIILGLLCAAVVAGLYNDKTCHFSIIKYA